MLLASGCQRRHDRIFFYGATQSNQETPSKKAVSVKTLHERIRLINMRHTTVQAGSKSVTFSSRMTDMTDMTAFS